MNRTNEQLIALFNRRISSLQAVNVRLHFTTAHLGLINRILNSNHWLGRVYRNEPQPDVDAIPQPYDLEIYARFIFIDQNMEGVSSQHYLITNMLFQMVKFTYNNSDTAGPPLDTNLTQRLDRIENRLNVNLNAINHDILTLHTGRHSADRRSLPVVDRIANYEARIRDNPIPVRENAAGLINLRNENRALRERLESLENRLIEMRTQLTSMDNNRNNANIEDSLPVRSSTPTDLTVRRASFQLIEIDSSCASIGTNLYFIGTNVSRFENLSLIYMEQVSSREVSITFFLREDYHRPARTQTFPCRPRITQALFDYIHNGEWPSTVTTVSYTQFRRVFTNPVNLANTLR